MGGKLTVDIKIIICSKTQVEPLGLAKERIKMSWKPTYRTAFAIPVARVCSIGRACLSLSPAGTSRLSLVPALQATWLILFAMPETASPAVQQDYWSLLIQNGIEIQ